MRFLYSIVFIFLFLPLGSVFAEEIRDFTSDIEINTDGSFVVTETITYDFGTLSRHGIFREIPLKHQQEASAWYKNRYLEVDIINVLMDSESVPYDVSEDAQQLSIKIANPDKEITGIHVYTIQYKVTGGLSYFDDDSVELYWNVTGHDWDVPIKKATARVQNEGNLLKNKYFCYTGSIGATDSCKQIIATSTNTIFISPLLPLGYGLTIAQEINKGQVGKVVLEKMSAFLLWGGGGLLWFLIVGWFVYRYKTAYKPQQSVVSQYEPFEDFKPMFTGVLIDGRLDAKDITAGLIYLAQEGFLKIKQTEEKVLIFFEVTDYEVTLLRDIEEIETRFLKDVLLLLFEANDSVGQTTKLSTLKRDTTKRSENSKAVQKLRAAVFEDLEKRGYFERILSFSALLIGAIVGVFLIPFALPFMTSLLGSFAVPILIIVIGTLVIVGFSYQRRTKKGYAALNHLKGFKEFLSVTEKDRYKFHNAPEKNPEQFMQFLPYAVAFGVEDKWAEVFKDIALPNPEWYEGNSAGAFVAANFASDLGAFSSSFTQSSSSSGSASGGGGFSGGGGGGGGGGSW